MTEKKDTHSEEGSPQAAQSAVEADAAGDSRDCIMIVDDTPENIDVLVGILAPDYELRLAVDGTMALGVALQDTNSLPDLILLDIMMPGMNGFEVCDQFKKNDFLKDIPIIFISALSATEDKLRALGSGAVDYVTKPFHPEEVRARVHTHLTLRKLRRELEARNTALEKALADLRASEELREDLTHMIVHDMRSPLTAIISAVDLMATRELDERGQGFLDMASRSARDLTEMVTSLLDINRMESGEMPLKCEKSDLMTIASDAVETLAASAVRREVELTINGHATEASVDRALIQRVFQNLIANALKFSGKKDRITIDVVEAPSCARVAITDMGPGIPEAYREKIFQKFGQVETRRENRALSTGLGLTFCKLAIETHGGAIGLNSEVGKGSTFWFTLPYQRPPAIDTDPASGR
jgi:two-component system sensor histidine kinase/response regulator